MTLPLRCRIVCAVTSVLAVAALASPAGGAPIVTTVTLNDQAGDTAPTPGFSPAAFAVSKSQTRQPVLDAVEKYAGGFDKAVDEIWLSPHSASHIRDYVSKTFKKI